MKKRVLTACTILAAVAGMACADNLEGFKYGSESAPTGKEWQDPEQLSLNKEQPKAWMFHFASEENARKVLPENSEFYQSLNGTWKFHWVATPEERPANFYEPSYDTDNWDDIAVPGCWNVQGLQKDGTMKWGAPIYVNQPVIFEHYVQVDDWKLGVMREPKDHRRYTYKFRNEVGSYRRNFTVPASWNGRQIFLNFDGVDSFFYLWINGKYVGFSKNSRNLAQFNITPYLNKKGENVLAVEVYRNSDGSFLESQDMFRLPGIYRDAYLTSTPSLEINDLAITTVDLAQDGNAKMNIKAEVRNHGKKEQPYTIDYAIYPVKMYSDDIEEGGHINLNGKSAQEEVTISNARGWNAEEPWRYVLTASLKDKKGKTLDVVSTYFGVCDVEIRDTPASEDEFNLAGRYFYVNDKPVKLKGVNRHENNPSTGHYVTHDQMAKEVMLMKRGNINHIRLSHYCNDPYLYYLANKYGLYLEDEANIESHEYYYGDASLSHVPEFKAAHVARNVEMVKAHINMPSIVIWSLGNEAGPGKNFVEAYNAIKKIDPRPVQYERNNNIVDMGSNQYPSIGWVRYAVQGTDKGIKYPFHISEYAHSMGNALGNFVDYWDAMESTNFFCGGAIWDWIDQAIDTYKEDGTYYFGYGGDHGEFPNDNTFCMNGIIFPDMEPKPQYWEVKKVYQNVGVKAVDLENGVLEIFNKNYFTPLSDYVIEWDLVKDGKVVDNGVFKTTRDIHGPRMAKNYILPVGKWKLCDKAEYYVNVKFLLGTDKPWAKKGYEQMNEQILLQSPKAEFASASKQAEEVAAPASYTEDNNKVRVEGENFAVEFCQETGSISYLRYGQNIVFGLDGRTFGPQLSAYRAPVDNDNWAWGGWNNAGLDNLTHKTTGKASVQKRQDGAVSVSYNVISSGKNNFQFSTSQIYTIYKDGSIELNSSIACSDPALALPRLGYEMKLPSKFNKYTYYGRGPWNNYNDRRTASFVGLYESSVEDQFVNFPRPQSMGNREEVRWCSLKDYNGNGVQFISTNGTMSTSALPWSQQELRDALHPCELPKSSGTSLHLDAKVTGLGGNSCGQGGPFDEDRVKGAEYQFGFIIRPVDAETNLTCRSKVSASGDMPISIVRNRAGLVNITTSAKDAKLMYQLEGQKKPAEFAEPFNLKQGGTVTAWNAANPNIKTTITFDKIDEIPVEVVFASSEETSGNNGAKNLTDGNPGTIWHTMYSVTVAIFPHWIDFDCGEVKTIKGFTYLPRQDGPNGNIKDYEIQISNDGKEWGDVVMKGSFANDQKAKKVMLPAPVKGRYFRFKALSSQNGQDFASGAEFSIIAE